MKRRHGVWAGALAVLATAGSLCAQASLSCPADTRVVSRAIQVGRMEYCESLADRKPHGPLRETYAGGGKRLEARYQDGKPDGRWLGWHTNGRPSGEADFRAGTLHRVVAWYDSGTLAFQGDFAAGNMTLFDGKGRMRMRVEMVNGKATEKFWNEQGREVASATPDLRDEITPQDFVQTVLLAAGVPPH